MIPVCERLRAMRPSSFAPCARYPSATTDEAGGEDGAFNCLDGAHGELLAQIEVDRADRASQSW